MDEKVAELGHVAVAVGFSPREGQGWSRCIAESGADGGATDVLLNGVVASLGVTEFMVYVTGLREPASQLTYRGERGIVTKSVDRPEPACYYCTRLWGTAVARG